MEHVGTENLTEVDDHHDGHVAADMKHKKSKKKVLIEVLRVATDEINQQPVSREFCAIIVH